MLLVAFVYHCQLVVLNKRFARLVNFIKRGRFRLTESKLDAHLASHKRLLIAFDRFNGDIFSHAAASVMTFITPYNIYLLAAIAYTRDSSSSDLVVDKLGLATSLIYQIFVTGAIATALCRLTDRFYSSARSMHGLQLCLPSDDFRISIHTKLKLAFHYEIVHSSSEVNRQGLTIGPFALSKQSACEVS